MSSFADNKYLYAGEAYLKRENQNGLSDLEAFWLWKSYKMPNECFSVEDIANRLLEELDFLSVCEAFNVPWRERSSIVACIASHTKLLEGTSRYTALWRLSMQTILRLVEKNEADLHPAAGWDGFLTDLNSYKADLTHILSTSAARLKTLYANSRL